MKTFLTRFTLGFLAAAALTLASCEKDEDKAMLSMNATPQLTASATNATLAAANGAAQAVTYSWSAADFGFPAGVVYTLQLAPQNNSSFDPAASAGGVQELNMGKELSKTFTVAELNGVYNAFNCNITTPTPTTLNVRVKASIGGASEPVYSTPTTIRASPFQAQTAPSDSWGILGDATATVWDSDTDMAYDFCSGTYKITNFRLDATGKFKFRANDAWAVNLGGAVPTAPGTPSAPLVAGGPNIDVPGGITGNYDITLNVTTKTFTWVRRP